MKVHLILVIIFVFVASCRIGEEHISFQSFSSFGIGEDKDGASSMMVSSGFYTGESDQMIIEVDSSSLCPYYGLEFQFITDNDTFRTEFVTIFPFMDTFEIPREKQIKIISAIENDPFNGTTCASLGKAFIKLRY